MDRLSFSARPGEFLGLLGPNGAGKTTALHILLGIIHPSSGKVSVLGASPFHHRERIYPRINFSSAYVQLPYNLKVERNLRFYAHLYDLRRPQEKTRELLEMFEIDHLAQSPTGTLSSGEQTRLNLCKSLLNDPEVLFLDEPTSSLDPEIAQRVRGLLKRIQSERHMTVIYTSHNMAEVESLCDRVLFIHRGHLVAEGAPDEVRASFEGRSLEEVFIRLVREGIG